MKIFLIVIVLFAALTSLSQDSFTEKIDTETTIEPFSIDAPKDKLEKYLGTEIKLEDYYLTSAYEVDIKKLPFKDYFGLPIEKMIVEFNEGVGPDGESFIEDVYRIVMHVQLPKSSEEKEAFTEKLLDFYGTCNYMWNPDYTEIVRLQWFSKITLLAVSLGVDVETGENQQYFVVEFYQAYGG